MRTSTERRIRADGGYQHELLKRRARDKKRRERNAARRRAGLQPARTWYDEAKEAVPVARMVDHVRLAWNALLDDRHAEFWLSAAERLVEVRRGRKEKISQTSAPLVGSCV